MKRLILSLLILLLIVSNVLVIYSYQLKSVNKDSKEVEFVVEKGETLITIADKLKKANLIRSVLAYKIYLKLNNVPSLQAGKYDLNSNMDVKDILSTLSNGSNYNPETVTVTIPEGKRIEEVATIVADVTNNTKEQLLDTWNSSEFIENVINKYWFITDEIKQPEIIYALEGYFFPSTYELLNKDVTPEYVAYKFLDQMDIILTKYKNEIESSSYSVHQLLTLASIVETEAILDEDRPLVASVFYNRLKDGWKLQSCATVGYAIGEWKLTYNAADLATDSKYNTYYYSGLPVGPGNMPGEASIKAVIEPAESNYYFFMANVCDPTSNKTYFAQTNVEHDANVKKYLGCLN